MSFHLFSSLKLFVKSNYYLFKAVRYPLIWIGYFERKQNTIVDNYWRERIDLVLSAPDNMAISRVSSAGKVEGDVQIMHNGLKIHVGSYYGDGNTVMLYQNKGVHEPEEERAFSQLLKFIPAGGTMIELGSFWGFYSMTFNQTVPKAINYLIEPDPHAFLSGINNFKLNKLKGNFFQYFVSDKTSADTVPIITIDEFVRQQHISRINILHSDIQGSELKMLHGSKDCITRGIVDYFFISTHSNELHEACVSYLKEHKYRILSNANLDESYSFDGLIVAGRFDLNGPEKIEIHKRPYR